MEQTLFSKWWDSMQHSTISEPADMWGWIVGELSLHQYPATPDSLQDLRGHMIVQHGLESPRHDGEKRLYALIAAEYAKHLEGLIAGHKQQTEDSALAEKRALDRADMFETAAQTFLEQRALALTEQTGLTARLLSLRWVIKGIDKALENMPYIANPADDKNDYKGTRAEYVTILREHLARSLVDNSPWP